MTRKSVVGLVLALALLCLLWLRRSDTVETAAPLIAPGPTPSDVSHEPAETIPSQLAAPRAEVVTGAGGSAERMAPAPDVGVLGVVRHDADVLASDLKIVLVDERASSTWKSVPLAATEDPERGQFTFADVATGTYAVRVLLDRDKELVEIGGIEVDGGRADDPRLAEIDVRGLVHVFEFEVFDELGAPFGRANLAFRPSDGSATWKSALVERGRARVVATRPELEVVLEQFDYRPLQESNVRGSQRFFMQRGIRVEVEVAGEPLPDGTRCRMVLNAPELRRDGGPSSWPTSASTKAQTEPRFVLFVPAAARYSVTLEYSLADGSQSAPLFDAVEPLDVRDVEGQVFRITPDPKAVADRLEYLGRQR
ncbi:MAG: hypothetical protein L6Q99_06940 [Planctomycetes bacterium]|nr:hypothetical protein [Planctomycetota bacterium]